MIILIGITKCLLKTLPFLRRIRRHLLIRNLDIFKFHQAHIQPFSIRSPLRVFFLDLLIRIDLACKGIH